MKVQELRQLLSGVDRTLLEKAFVESYKQFSKAKKEKVDLLIQEILEGKEVKKTDKNAVLDFDAFEQEVLDFIANAKAQNYLAPNRIIPKNQRSKWRFLVKNYIKALDKIQLEDPNYDRAVILLEAIYKLMCHGCNYYIFFFGRSISFYRMAAAGSVSAVGKKILMKILTISVILSCLCILCWRSLKKGSNIILKIAGKATKRSFCTEPLTWWTGRTAKISYG